MEKVLIEIHFLFFRGGRKVIFIQHSAVLRAFSCTQGLLIVVCGRLYEVPEFNSISATCSVRALVTVQSGSGGLFVSIFFSKRKYDPKINDEANPIKRF